MIRNKKIENYMKTIYQLKQNGPVRGAYIARELAVSKPMVSATLRELQEEGFIEVSGNKTIELTEKGLRIAQRIVERNQIIYSLLIELGVDKNVAEKDACNIEHYLSDDSIQAFTGLKNYLTFIRKAPFRAEE